MWRPCVALYGLSREAVGPFLEKKASILGVLAGSRRPESLAALCGLSREAVDPFLEKKASILGVLVGSGRKLQR